jgi:AraC family transcriptional regulator
VREHIHDHLDDKLDLFSLADVACLSPHHWHRIYHALHGETLAETVKRLRLHRAAGDLANGSMPVADVARRSGYDNLQSFTRIFKSVYGMPPARYRREGTHAPFQEGGRAPVEAGYAVSIQTMPTLVATGVEHRGSFMAVGRAFDTLFATLAARGVMLPAPRLSGVYFSDPTAVEESELHSVACVLGEWPAVTALPLQRVSIECGPYAVLRHTGPYATMKSAYDWLYGDWLPQSGREPADAPVVEHYLNSPHNTPPLALATDICLPLLAV